MKKGLVVGLAVAMFFAFFVQSIWAQKAPSLPKGARLIEPDSIQKIGEQGEMLASDEVITEPYIYAYTVPGQKGARLGVGASASFPITGFDVWADDQRVGAMVTAFFAGTIPNLVPSEPGIQQDLGFLTPEILLVGTHTVEVPVYPDYPNSNVHFLGTFKFEVQWFEFFVWGCVEADTVRLSFYISPIGEMPTQVSISTSAFTGNAIVVDGVAELPFNAAVYGNNIGGQELKTTLTEVGGAGRSATQTLWYPPLDELYICGGKG